MSQDTERTSPDFSAEFAASTWSDGASRTRRSASISFINFIPAVSRALFCFCTTSHGLALQRPHPELAQPVGGLKGRFTNLKTEFYGKALLRVKT